MKLLEFLQLSWRERFPSFGAPSPFSRKLAEEECPLISRGIAQKSTASFQYLHSKLLNFDQLPQLSWIKTRLLLEKTPFRLNGLFVLL
jgi:hypothetical protein